MKVTYRIPTNEPYAYVEIEDEYEGVIQPTDVEIMYASYTKAIKGEPEGFGLTEKDFNAVLDELLTTKKITGDPGMLDEMTREQKDIIQSIKRSHKRTQ